MFLLFQDRKLPSALRAQEVLQMFLFERIIDRLAASSFRDNFILKGGLLISSMIGIGERTSSRILHADEPGNYCTHHPRGLVQFSEIQKKFRLPHPLR